MLEERLVQNLPRLLVHLKMQKENSYQDNLPMIEKKILFNHFETVSNWHL